MEVTVQTPEVSWEAISKNWLSPLPASTGWTAEWGCSSGSRAHTAAPVWLWGCKSTLRTAPVRPHTARGPVCSILWLSTNSQTKRASHQRYSSQVPLPSGKSICHLLTSWMDFRWAWTHGEISGGFALCLVVDFFLKPFLSVYWDFGGNSEVKI